MEMTIDEAISHLDTYSSTMGSGQTTQAQHEESKRVSIDTMRKYQKIEEIIHDDWIKGVNSGATLNKIEEVLEDGKIY